MQSKYKFHLQLFLAVKMFFLRKKIVQNKNLVIQIVKKLSYLCNVIFNR